MRTGSRCVCTTHASGKVSISGPSCSRCCGLFSTQRDGPAQPLQRLETAAEIAHRPGAGPRPCTTRGTTARGSSTRRAWSRTGSRGAGSPRGARPPSSRASAERAAARGAGNRGPSGSARCAGRARRVPGAPRATGTGSRLSQYGERAQLGRLRDQVVQVRGARAREPRDDDRPLDPHGAGSPDGARSGPRAAAGSRAAARADERVAVRPKGESPASRSKLSSSTPSGSR